MSKTVLMPLPDHDFDVTEVAVPWKILTEAGHRVIFATEHGGVMPEADHLLFRGVIFGKLGAHPEPIAFYREMENVAEFRTPMSWKGLDETAFDGLFLAGGHAPRMRQYLGSSELHGLVSRFWQLDRPVAAICHGVIVAARAVVPNTGKSVIHDKRTTCLPKYMERSAYWLTAWKLGRYYRTYPAYVEDEVRSVLANPRNQFVRGPRTLSARGTRNDDSPAFTVRDGHYITARWPGDAYRIAKEFHTML